MEGFWVHPLVVVTYAALVPSILGGAYQLFRLFHRVGEVENSTKRLEKSFDTLSDELRGHMDDEEKSARLLQLAMFRLEEKLNELSRPSFRE